MATDVSLKLSRYDFTPESSDAILTVEGTSIGIIGQILSALGLNQVSSLTITHREATFKFSNLGGITYIVCPLNAMTCSLCGIQKPMWQLWVGILCILGGPTMLGSSALVGLILLAVGAFLVYTWVTSKNLALTFSTGDMLDTRGLGFDATTVAGKKIEVEELLTAIRYVNKEIVALQQPGAH